MQSPGDYGFFYQAKIMAGTGAMANIPVELDGFDARHPFVLTDKKTSDSGLPRKFVKALGESNTIIGALFDDVPAYSSVSLVKDLAQFFRDRGCDSVVAIGSGPVVDVAKGVNMAVSTGADVLGFEGVNRVPGHLKPLVVVPTAAIKPFDLTGNARIDGRKFSSAFLMPDVIAVDPLMVRGCCTECVLDTAMVSLSHAVEAYLSPSANPLSDAYASMAIRLIAEHLQKSLKRPGNKAASMGMANAAVAAAAAFDNQPVGVVHALGMELSLLTGNAPGLCMGILLPAALEYRRQMKQEARSELLMAMEGFDAYAGTPAGQRGEKGLRSLQLLFSKIAVLPRTLEELRVPRFKADEAIQEALKANPSLKKQDLSAVMGLAMKGVQ